MKLNKCVSASVILKSVPNSEGLYAMFVQLQVLTCKRHAGESPIAWKWQMGVIFKHEAYLKA